MAKAQDHKEYLHQKIHPILEKLMQEVSSKRPANPIDYMLDWLKTHSGSAPATNQSLKPPAPAHNDDELSAKSDNEDETPPLPTKEELQKKLKAKYGRSSVSAEVYGQFNQKGSFKAKIVDKSEDQKQRIWKRLSQAFMFNALDDAEKMVVIMAMEEKQFKKDDHVIDQGADGDNLYVVDSGELKCFRKPRKDAEDVYLKTYHPGDAFGELALLYNAPRAATIIADTDSILFALDRETFNHIVKGAAARKREMYESLLQKIELLHDIDAYERSKIADAFKPCKFKAGDRVVKEGDKGDVFYFVAEGEAFATKLKPDGTEDEVYSYKAGDYFGELSLLKDTPRAASITAKTDLSLVSMDRYSFKRLLGPLEDILKRNFSRYEKYAQK